MVGPNASVPKRPWRGTEVTRFQWVSALSFGQTRIDGTRPPGARLIDAGDAGDPRPRTPCVAHMRVRQHGGEQRRLVRAQVLEALAERATRTGLGAELAVRAPFGDVEIDLHQAPLAEHEVKPHGKRQLERLADDVAAL